MLEAWLILTVIVVAIPVVERLHAFGYWLGGKF